MEQLGFKKWLFEVGSSGGVGGGLTPAVEVPSAHATALQDYHGEGSSDPENPSGSLPPIKKKTSKVYKSNGRHRKSNIGHR
jgi:hypothetical protein